MFTQKRKDAKKIKSSVDELAPGKNSSGLRLSALHDLSATPWPSHSTTKTDMLYSIPGCVTVAVCNAKVYRRSAETTAAQHAARSDIEKT